jgi:hypothetical protein
MTWAALLLADPSPCLRFLVLRQLLELPADDPEVLELARLRLADPLVTSLLSEQQVDGSWIGGSHAYGATGASVVLSTAFALARLGYLGFDPTHPAVAKAAAFLFSQQQPDGSWMLNPAYQEDEDQPRTNREGYSMVPLQTALPLRGLAACGFAADTRAEKAYDWLLARRLPDGAWPTGIAGGGVYGYVAGYRRLAHSRWGCRSNTTAALLCLALHPDRRRSPEARRALDLLLGRETRERHAMGFEVARLLGAELAHGFFTFFARFDLALILDLCARVELSLQDERLRSLVEFVDSICGPYGLWEYAEQPQVSRWVTFDLLRSLDRLDRTAGWIGLEPRTPFQPYPSRKKRY